MWRFLQRVVRPLNQTIRSAPQGVCRDDAENPVQCQHLDPLYHRQVLFMHRRHYSRKHDKTRSGDKQEDSQQEDEQSTDCDWDEWLRCFRRDFRYSAAHPYSALEAVGWGTALLLGIHLSQYYNVWNRRCTRHKESTEVSINYWAHHLRYVSQALPHVSSSVLSTTRTFCIQNEGSFSTGSVSEDSNHVRKITDRDKSEEHWDDFLQLPLLVNETSEFRNLQFDADNSTVKISPPIPEVTSKSIPETLDSLTAAVADWAELELQHRHAHANLAACHKLEAGQAMKALDLWKKASNGGYAKASFNLGLCYELGNGGVDVDLRKSLEFYSLAAEQGHGKAMYNLAQLYLRGDSRIPKKLDVALVLLENAAKQGLSKAQTDLGVIYTKQPYKDMVKAASMFQEAANQKDMNGQYYLGICYQHGMGVEQNLCRAAELYKNAARLGHADAQYNLGVFFDQGLGGLPEDKEAAVEWYKKAAKGGNKSAGKLLSALENQPLQIPGSDAERVTQCMSCHQFNDTFKFELTTGLDRSASSPTLSDYVKIRLQLGSGFMDSENYGLNISNLMEKTDRKSDDRVSFCIGDSDDDHSFKVGISSKISVGWPAEKTTEFGGFGLDGSFGIRPAKKYKVCEYPQELSSVASDSSFDITFQEMDDIPSCGEISAHMDNSTKVVSCM